MAVLLIAVTSQGMSFKVTILLDNTHTHTFSATNKVDIPTALLQTFHYPWVVEIHSCFFYLIHPFLKFLSHVFDFLSLILGRPNYY